ncbi:MAG: hypothetical protein ACI8RN_002628 [Glaciecola sp.]|jgi:hypothetical protein|uniref:hypothetical protein n=1 Tax=Congregibacter sp. TaxID=2744308 RepID=UPI0039E4ACB6
MNWDAVGAVGEIVGATAVVASLLYLAVQTRANAKALRANAIWNSETVFGAVNYSHGANPEWAHLISRSVSPGVTMSDLSPTEQSQIQFTFRGALQYFQAQWSLWNEGLVPDELWERRRKGLRQMIEAPVMREIWDEEVRQHTIPDEFKVAIESTALEGATSIGGFT